MSYLKLDRNFPVLTRGLVIAIALPDLYSFLLIAIVEGFKGGHLCLNVLPSSLKFDDISRK